MKVHRLIQQLERIILDNMGADLLEIVVQYGTERDFISRVSFVPGNKDAGDKDVVALEIR